MNNYLLSHFIIPVIWSLSVGGCSVAGDLKDHVIPFFRAIFLKGPLEQIRRIKLSSENSELIVDWIIETSGIDALKLRLVHMNISFCYSIVTSSFLCIA